MEPDSERTQNQTTMIFVEAVKGLVSSPQQGWDTGIHSEVTRESPKIRQGYRHHQL